MIRLILIVLVVAFSHAFAAEPFRTIAILENERMLEAEPDISLVRYFSSPSKDIRLRAVLAAARIGNPAVLSALQPLAADDDANVRKHVAFALGQIRSKEGLDTVTKLLKDSDRQVRRLAIQAVGRIGGLDVSALIIPFLRDPDPHLREETALALALIKDRGTVEILSTLAKSNDPAQWSYVYALYRLADKRSLPALHAALANPRPGPSTDDPSSLLFALKALWSLKQPLTAEEASRMLSDEDSRVQQNALDVIAASVDKERCAILHSRFKAMDVLTKMKALETMGALGCVIAEQPSEPGLLGAWILARAKADKEKALEVVKSGTKQEDWTIRWRSAQALSELPPEPAIPLLTELSRDPDSAVRLAALESLAKFMPRSAEIFESLISDQDFAVRAVAIDALAKTKDPKYLPAIIQAYDASSDPSEIEGRVAILDALAEFQSSETLPVYEKALDDPEYAIRLHAVEALKKLAGSRLHLGGQTQEPDRYLHRQGKVNISKQQEYPADFGKPVAPSVVRMELEKGTVVIRLLGDAAPLHGNNFKKLIGQKFFDGLRIHRVVPNFVIQGGDPRGDGWGGAGEVLHDQFNLLPFTRGMVGMPTAGKDTGGSQFFITHSRQPHLDGNYTIFGEVISGMDVVDRTEVGDKIVSVTLVRR